MIPEVPAGYGETRLTLQRVACHVLARARFQACGKFGLRATPGGFGTPMFGSDFRVLRVDGERLHVEVDKRVTVVAIAGATLAGLAAAAAADLAADFQAGHDTPPLGDVDAPLALDPGATAIVAGWYALGCLAIDEVVAGLAPGAEPSVIQLWPEHFDAGCDVGTPGGRVNLGASPGDGPDGTPYFYVGPWGPERPGDPEYWNASFGATLGYDEVRAGADPAAFMRRGLSLLGAALRT